MAIQRMPNKTTGKGRAAQGREEPIRYVASDEPTTRSKHLTL